MSESELRMKTVGQRKIEGSDVWSAVRQLTETAEHPTTLLPDNAVRDVSADEVGVMKSFASLMKSWLISSPRRAGSRGKKPRATGRFSNCMEWRSRIVGIDTLIGTKLTVRPHDAADREYLERLR